MHHDIRQTARKIARRLELITPLAHRRTAPLAPLRFKTLAGPMDPPPLGADLDDSAWQVIPPRSYWGGRMVNFVMRGAFTVPGDFDHDSPIALYLPLGDAGGFSHPEALAYIDGHSYATTDKHHPEFLLAPDHRDGTEHLLVLHGWTGGTSDDGHKLFMQQCAVVQLDAPTREFIAAARTALQAAEMLDSYEPAKLRLLNALDDAFIALDTREPLGDSFYASVPGALDVLRAGFAAAGPPLDVELIAAGHAHIDVAWLWTLGQTRRKAGRSFSTVMRLMEQFPDYHFTQSQPQLYDYVRQDYPDLFDEMKQRVADGRWEPIGGMWVEADCNISGPESLARQFLIGRSFFREHFDRDAESPVLWLPDVFGYAWNLPQLIKLAGMEYFFTIKIGWNRTNKLPFDSFWWQGLDGTKVLTHFSTSPEAPWGNQEPNMLNPATYNADLNAFSVLGSWAKLQHKEAQNTLLMSYGWGDGGGGPSREMNENAREMRSFPALPKVKQGKVIDFYRRLEAESGASLPTWNAELYLEIHRGTYTTQSRNKRANRKAEFALHDAEFAATFAAQLDPAYQYPHDKLHRAWELVCLNQFHDIIPGSSIGAVYEESQQQYAEIMALAEAARDGALEVLKEKAGGTVVLVNPTSFWRNDVAFWPGELPAGQRLAAAYSQAVEGGTLIAEPNLAFWSGELQSGRRFANDVPTQAVEGGTLIAGLSLAPFSVTALKLLDPGARQLYPPHDSAGVLMLVGPDSQEVFLSSELQATPRLLENGTIRVELNDAGDITRIYDKFNFREVLPPGAIANQWQAFEDRPVDWDAWDVDIFYDDKMFLAEPAESITVIESGPIRATLEIKRRILNSSYTQRISLLNDSPLIRVDTTIDWRERHILLKAAFPVDVLAPTATFEIQWGSVQRPTHRNTSWDWARFETCAQKWVDLSEGNYGMALLNDCKYGHDIRDNVIRISLLRSPTNPDPEADQGEHHFSYALLPHVARTNQEIAAAAYGFNDPLIALTGNGRPADPQPSLISPAEGTNNIIIETIKKAEDGNGIIVRFYECNRERGWVALEAGFPLKSAHIINLLEEDGEELAVNGKSVRIYVTPFQIVSVRLLAAE